MKTVIKLGVPELVAIISSRISTKKITKNVCILTDIEHYDITVEGITIYIRNVNNPEKLRGLSYKNYIMKPGVRLDNNLYQNIIRPSTAPFKKAGELRFM